MIVSFTILLWTHDQRKIERKNEEKNPTKQKTTKAAKSFLNILMVAEVY